MQHFLGGDDEEYIFACLCLTLEWNLMSCYENGFDCHAENLLWTEDALGFIFLAPRLTKLGSGVMPFDMFMLHPILLALVVILLLLAIC